MLEFKYIAVVGSRSWTDRECLNRILNRAYAKYRKQLCIVSGACPDGADFLAEKWAKKRGCPCFLFPADWSEGRGAGFARNYLIVEAASVVIAFWDCKSDGTFNSLSHAFDLGKEVFVVTPDHKDLRRLNNLVEAEQLRLSTFTA